MNSTDLTNFDAEVAAAISAGTTTIAEVRDAMGNSTRYASFVDTLRARSELAQIITKTARTKSFDKVVFEAKE